MRRPRTEAGRFMLSLYPISRQLKQVLAAVAIADENDIVIGPSP
jgi:hypothetical protein